MFIFNSNLWMHAVLVAQSKNKKLNFLAFAIACTSHIYSEIHKVTSEIPAFYSLCSSGYMMLKGNRQTYSQAVSASYYLFHFKTSLEEMRIPRRHHL